jgi:hypothetical protein
MTPAGYLPPADLPRRGRGGDNTTQSTITSREYPPDFPHQLLSTITVTPILWIERVRSRLACPLTMCVGDPASSRNRVEAEPGGTGSEAARNGAARVAEKSEIVVRGQDQPTGHSAGKLSTRGVMMLAIEMGGLVKKSKKPIGFCA